ncbi:hypothetical protein CFO_g2186 [Ceratocystis platani]|uniref:Rhodopsin domain-containing protein n=1 Tax=Ceratocystis fimbriata f. sp. platani TaxID=88771 RepID=A0A0F8B278_CERFI|nr:hypothetical protein CFO_g2186 [Ceratocystis platani]
MESLLDLAQRALLFLGQQPKHQYPTLIDRAESMPVHFVYMKPKDIVRDHLIINCVLGFFTVVVVVLRVVSRVQTQQGPSNFGLDDFFVCIALPQALVMLVVQGLILLLVLATPPQKPWLICRLYCDTLCIKLSALFFYLRVFVNRSLKFATKATIWFVLLWSIGNILQVFLICRPFKAAIDPNTPGTCGSQKASFIAIGCFNAVTDLMILVLPIHTVWSLKARLGMKVALTAVLTIGLLVTVVSVWRLVALTKLRIHTNLTGTMVYASFLSATEPLLGILCISLPMLRPATHLRCAGRRQGISNKNSQANGGGDFALTSSKARARRLESNVFAVGTNYDDDDDEMQIGHNLKASRTESRNSDGTDGSEADLNAARLQGQDGIKLQRKWVVSHV